MNGKYIYIYKGGTPIAACKTDTVSTKAETTEVTDANDSTWKYFIAGQKTWKFQTTYLLLADEDIAKLLQIGNSYTIIIRGKTTDGALTGTAILTDAKQTYAVGSIASGSWDFQGTGPLEELT